MTIPPLTPKQQQLITLTYRFRFLSRLHYQFFLNHKSPSLTKSWLSDLSSKHFLVSERSKTFGENTKPTVYHIGKNGISLLKTMFDLESDNLHYLYSEASRFPTFKTHCLTLADFCCNILKLARMQKKPVTFYTKTDYRTIEKGNERLTLLKTISPDGYYAFSGTGVSKNSFIEIMDETTPAFVMRGRFRKYIRCYQDELWEEALNISHFPSLIFIVPNEKKFRSLKRAITQVRNEFDDEEVNTQIRCNIAYSADIQSKGIADSIWKQA